MSRFPPNFRGVSNAPSFPTGNETSARSNLSGEFPSHTETHNSSSANFRSPGNAFVPPSFNIPGNHSTIFGIGARYDGPGTSPGYGAPRAPIQNFCSYLPPVANMQATTLPPYGGNNNSSYKVPNYPSVDSSNRFLNPGQFTNPRQNFISSQPNIHASQNVVLNPVSLGVSGVSSSSPNMHVSSSYPSIPPDSHGPSVQNFSNVQICEENEGKPFHSNSSTIHREQVNSYNVANSIEKQSHQVSRELSVPQNMMMNAGGPLINPPTYYQSQMFNMPPPHLSAPVTALVSPHIQMHPGNVFQIAHNDNSVISNLSLEEWKMKQLLEKYELKKKDRDRNSNKITVAEFRVLMCSAFDILKALREKKEELKSTLADDEENWTKNVKQVNKLQELLSEIFGRLSNPDNITHVFEKLCKIKNRRKRKRLQNINFALMKKQKEQDRAEILRDIDRWYETLKEKDLQAKREEEMKKEADDILSEVRKKIYEAKRTIEKLRILEKLRQARRENAVKKGMFILPKNDRNFEVRISKMKDVMRKQLVDYEAEERALKVMLETEQEGQREEEAQWRMKKLKEIQDGKHERILSCLFGDSDPPSETSEIYLFWQHHNVASASIDNLVSVRRLWDLHLVPPDSSDGSNIPQHWVVPEPPSTEMWSSVIEKNN